MLCLLAQFQRQDSFSSTSSGDSGTPIDGPYDYDAGVIGHMETVAYKVRFCNSLHSCMAQLFFI